MAKDHETNEVEVSKELTNHETHTDKHTKKSKKQITISGTTAAIIVLFIAVIALFAYTTTKQDKIHPGDHMPMRGSAQFDRFNTNDSYHMRNR